MKVKKLCLQNYGRFDDLEMEFAPNNEIKGNVTIIVGNNGAGKSQILQALATGFSWFVNELVFKNNQNQYVLTKQSNNEYLSLPDEGDFICQHQIKNNKKQASIKIYLDDKKNDKLDKNNFHIEINTNISGVRSLNIGDFREFVDFYHNHIKKYEFANLPIIAQYTVNRNIEATNINLSLNFAYSKFIGYQNFWNAGSEYSSFFQWFKDFEDLENENNRNLSYKFDEMMQIQSEIEKLLQSKEHYMDIDDFESDEDKFNILANISKQIEEKREHYTTMKLRNIVIASSLQNNIQLPLQYVRQAIELFTDFKNIRIERQGTPKMVVEKDGEKLDVNQLSQGEKSLLALVGDIARRLAILNPSFDNPLQGEGVVLIDEVDLHLHPKWQQNLVDKLTKTFPNVQFILTTHSPHIVSDNPDVLVYILDNGQLKQYHNAYGEDANTLLNGVFGVSERTQEIAEKFKLIGDYIADKQLDNAKNLIDELSKILPKNNTQLLSTQLSWAKAKLAQSKEV